MTLVSNVLTDRETNCLAVGQDSYFIFCLAIQWCGMCALIALCMLCEIFILNNT